MVQTRASEAASSLACLQSRRTHGPLHDSQDPKFELEIVMEDVEIDDTASSGSDSWTYKGLVAPPTMKTIRAKAVTISTIVIDRCQILYI
jgi:hypothetical protein